MAKIRMIKTEVRTSEKVASWPLEVRYFWILLWGYVDDHGKGKDNPLLIKADCFPLDENITSETVDQWLCVLAESGVIVRYEVAGTRYLAVKNWSEHQKPQHPGKDLFPNYFDANATVLESDEECMQPSCNLHATCTPELSRDELSRDNLFNDVERESSYSEDFESWWKLYPRKQGKGLAYSSWLKAIAKDKPDVLIDAAGKYAKSPSLPSEVKFIPLPATWLNQERWNDDFAPAKPDIDPDWWMYPQESVSV
jgi:hypothetical protein